VRDLEAIMDGMRSPDNMNPPYHVGAVEISVCHAQDSFHVMLDGRVFGPFKKLRVQPSAAWGEDSVVIPLMSFFPITS